MVDLELPPKIKEKFYSTVWAIVRLIPPGRVSPYGQIAGFIPCPAEVSPEDYKAYRARWVGNAMSASPQGVPWQRVINAQGKISFRQSGSEQRRLLMAEGIPFDSHDRIDLKTFGWEGPPADWLRANGLIAPDQPQQLSFLS
ncbi:MAG: MGMT family protein [Anaerolineaceae bacterium]|nr:MGMT family protein [Anaerolineaceae bacterium]